MLKTDRLTLRPFVETDLEAFAALHADPQAMQDYGTVMSRDQAEARLLHIIHAWRADGYGRFAVFMGPAFVGYVGVMHRGEADHPLGPHDEIGWRLHGRYLGYGLATEAARAALIYTQQTGGRSDILTYTAPDNLASQAVMARLKLHRVPELDFDMPYLPHFDLWRGLVWRVPPHFGGIE